MIRNNRHVTRLFFLLVIGMALFGQWYASKYWQPQVEQWELPTLSDDGDWVDFISAIGEAILLLFLGLASPGGG